LGVQKELLNTEGSIQNCQFAPTGKHLYCWLTALASGEVYIEQPYLAEIDLQTLQTKTLVSLAKYQDSKISVAPDGLGILFERSPRNNVATAEPSAASSNSIWLAIPNSTQQANSNPPIVEQLPFVGFQPQWLP
jgi:hypothetical protein